MKLYTRTGDAGETSLLDGSRVRKDHARVDAFGDIDELNAWLGFARAASLGAEFHEEVVRIQRDLFALGAQLADPADRIADRVHKAALGDAEVLWLEQFIDRLQEGLPPLTSFILAGGCPAGAALHVARAVCRRAERRMVALEPAVDPALLRYANRLSDLLFVLARAVNHRAGAAETAW